MPKQALPRDDTFYGNGHDPHPCHGCASVHGADLAGMAQRPHGDAPSHHRNGHAGAQACFWPACWPSKGWMPRGKAARRDCLMKARNRVISSSSAIQTGKAMPGSNAETSSSMLPPTNSVRLLWSSSAGTTAAIAKATATRPCRSSFGRVSAPATKSGHDGLA